jgi:hypothetical protein
MSEKKEQLPLDAKLLSLAIIELNISRRNVAIYPDNHPSIKASIDKAFSHLKELFELRHQITLAIAKDTLIIDEYALDKQNPVYAEFAISLSKIGIASLTFIAGTTEEEISKFHRIITTDPDVIQEKGGLEQLISDVGINHIKVGLIDYSAFHFVEGKKEVSKEKLDLWENYIFGFMEGTLLTESDGEAVRGIPPEILSEIVNKSMSGSEDAKTYENVITTYLHKSSEDTRLKKGALGNVMTFIEGLNPNLKKQFLSGTFRTLSVDPKETKKIAEGMSSEKLMQVLKEVNERDEIIPETLSNLLEKFSKVRVKPLTIDTRHIATGGSVIDDIQLSPEAVKLFEEESRFADYVTASYKEELENIMDAEFNKVDETVKNQIEEAFEESIDRFLAELLIELLETNMLAGEEIQKSEQKFLDYINLFLQTGQFSELTLISDKMTEFHEHNLHDNLATTIIDNMKSDEFITDLMASYRFWGRKNREEVIEFSKRLKEVLIAPLLDAVIEEQNTFLRSFYLSILSGFGEFVVPYAQKRLTDERWYVKRNMLHLLRETGNKTVLKHIKPYCESKDMRLSMEAMKAFLYFDSPDGNRFIKEHLQSKKIEIRDQVVNMIGTFKVARLVPDLIKLLIKKDALGGDFHIKIPIVNALGEIGDARALRYLLDICKSKSMLYKGSLDRLKVAIYKSLAKYPLQDIQPLVDEGLKSKNEEIMETCSILLDRIKQNG